MKNNKISISTFLINLSFFLYFVILFVERVISVILSLNHGVAIFDNFYHESSFLLVFLSLIATIVFLLIACRAHFKALFTRNIETFKEINWKSLCIATGILLVSGMIHLDDTNISGLQFASYGILIVGLLLKCIESHKNSHDKFTLWLSFVYLVCFAMAVPVVYPYVGDYYQIIYALEFVGMLLLVIFFTFFEIKLFSSESKNNLFFVVPFAFIVVLDTVLLFLRWNNPDQMIKDANAFVLIFFIATVAVYLIYLGYVVIKKIRK